jgi:3-oxoacyl-[acyl-carrier-protein] synthase-3
MTTRLAAISYALPKRSLTNEQLAADFPDWTVGKIENKTGIKARHISAADECSSDLGVAAAEALFAEGSCSAEDIDYLLFCTQSPDYFLPTTACLIQDRLGIPISAGALDFNLGCSGYIYGLGLARGLIESQQANRVLLITAETYTKLIHPADRSVRTLFGDAGAATLIERATDRSDGKPGIGPFVYGTDGRGADNLIVPVGGFRNQPDELSDKETTDSKGNVRAPNNLYMNGGEIFSFTIRVVPHAIGELLEKAQLDLNDVDLFIFHQANTFMLNHLRKSLSIPQEKFYVSLSDIGNTVSCTIPIAMRRAMDDGAIRQGMKVMLVGFGVGYSWGATLVRF